MFIEAVGTIASKTLHVHGPTRNERPAVSCCRSARSRQVALAVGAWLALAPSFVNAQCRTLTAIPDASWHIPTKGPADETHEEREFKFALKGAGVTDATGSSLATAIQQILDGTRKVKNLWQYPVRIESAASIHVQEIQP